MGACLTVQPLEDTNAMQVTRNHIRLRADRYIATIHLTATPVGLICLQQAISFGGEKDFASKSLYNISFQSKIAWTGRNPCEREYGQE
jgi:hypothetical protein